MNLFTFLYLLFILLIILYLLKLLFKKLLFKKLNNINIHKSITDCSKKLI